MDAFCRDMFTLVLKAMIFMHHSVSQTRVHMSDTGLWARLFAEQSVQAKNFQQNPILDQKMYFFVRQIECLC